MPPLLDLDETMEDAVVHTSPPPAQDSVAKADLKHAFETQEKRLKEIFQAELDKRLPPLPTASATISLAEQAVAFWNSLMPSSDHNVNQGPVLETLLKKYSELRQEICSLQASQTQLQCDNSSLEKTCSSMKEDYASIRRQLAEERVKNQELETKTVTLRSMLIPTTESQMSDSEVVAKFTQLRSQILKFVKVTSTRDFKKMTPTKEQFKLFRPFSPIGKIDIKYLDDRLRGEVFAILHDKIFSVPHYALGKDEAVLHNCLSAAESHMKEKLCTDSHPLISDWRVATMNMTASFREDRFTLARVAYYAIDTLFDIIERRKSKAAECDQLLDRICKDAVDLSLMMRCAKDEYRVHFPNEALGKPVSEFEKMVEDEVSHPITSKGEQPGNVAYFVTGALVKLPYSNVTDVKVLEKALAAVFCPSEKKV